MARLNTRPLLASVTIGGVAAIALVLLPSTALESIISRTHLADIMAAAKPPLGPKARLLIAAIPLVIASLIGLVLGFVAGRRRPSSDDYGDYGAYSEFDVEDSVVRDPFAPAPAPAPAAAAPARTPEPAPIAPEKAAAEPLPPPTPAPAPPAPPDSITSADLTEIADAIVRLDARLDAIEAKLESTPADARATAPPSDLPARLAKIAQSLDAAG